MSQEQGVSACGFRRVLGFLALMNLASRNIETAAGPHMPSAMCSARAKFFNPQKAFVCFLKKWGLKTLLYGCSFRREQFDRRACPYVEVEPKLKGLSQERSCHKNLELRRACPKSGHVPIMLKGMSPERGCPKNVEGHVPRAVLSQELGT